MNGPLVVLSGGVGGAKLVEGAYHLRGRAALTAIVNTGDDFEHLGLRISPDIDSVLYALSGRADRERGWGRAGETWQFMHALTELAGPDWFQLGDLDLATHVLRTHHLRGGATLTAATECLTAALGIDAQILPMSDDLVATMVDTDEGILPFQDYFVRRQCAPMLRSIAFAGAAQAVPGPGVLPALDGAAVILLAPSNPFLSIDPILAVPGLRAAIEAATAPVVAVSPLIGGKSIKGPTAKIMSEYGLEMSNEAIIAHYDGLIHGIVTDHGDPPPANLPSLQTDTFMRSLDDKQRVAQASIDLALKLSQ